MIHTIHVLIGVDKTILGESVTKRTFDNVTRNEETRNQIRPSTSTKQGSTKNRQDDLFVNYYLQ